MTSEGKTMANWMPPEIISREDIIKMSETLLAKAELPLKQSEDVFRIHEVGFDWDIGAVIYEPEDSSKIPVGADGNKVGIFLLHGGAGDFKQMEELAFLIVHKYGFKVVSGTFPGRFYLDNPSRDWPGDPIREDGTVRTPIWLKGEYITPDQYEVVRDQSMRMRYGTRTLARAKPDTLFWYRMAAWPVAMEMGMRESMLRHFPVDEYSVYLQGHSTGGPMVSMLCQRVPNAAGVLAAENSPFGYIDAEKHLWSGALGKIGGYEKISNKKKVKERTDPFYELYIRSWRDRARYAGPEALGQEGPAALMRLPWLMEEVLESWDKLKMRPQFKTEYLITHNIRGSLTEAAEVTAKRLNMNKDETDALAGRYTGYTQELRGSNVKPVPPFLFGIAKDSRDHHIDGYREIVLPGFAKMDPPPRTAITRFGAGIHNISSPEQDLPLGIAPAIVQSWHDAIMGGYFVVA
jgi:pimeloyl-ACP methyl ester carboxylesterase